MRLGNSFLESPSNSVMQRVERVIKYVRMCDFTDLGVPVGGDYLEITTYYRLNIFL